MPARPGMMGRAPGRPAGPVPAGRMRWADAVRLGSGLSLTAPELPDRQGLRLVAAHAPQPRASAGTGGMVIQVERSITLPRITPRPGRHVKVRTANRGITRRSR